MNLIVTSLALLYLAVLQIDHWCKPHVSIHGQLWWHCPVNGWLTANPAPVSCAGLKYQSFFSSKQNGTHSGAIKMASRKKPRKKAAADPKKITSFKAFHKLVPQIIEQITKDEALSVRAAVNPLLAIEELGYRLAPDVRRHVEILLRFPPQSRKKISQLEKDIHQFAGEEFDIDDEKELNRVLFEKLKLEKPQSPLFPLAEDLIRKGRDFIEGKPPAWSDPLEAQKEAHAIIKPLLAYRQLMAERPGFAPRELYEQIKTGRRKLPVSRVRIDLPEHRGEYTDA